MKNQSSITKFALPVFAFTIFNIASSTVTAQQAKKEVVVIKNLDSLTHNFNPRVIINGEEISKENFEKEGVKLKLSKNTEGDSVWVNTTSGSPVVVLDNNDKYVEYLAKKKEVKVKHIEYGRSKLSNLDGDGDITIEINDKDRITFSPANKKKAINKKNDNYVILVDGKEIDSPSKISSEQISTIEVLYQKDIAREMPEYNSKEAVIALTSKNNYRAK